MGGRLVVFVVCDLYDCFVQIVVLSMATLPQPYSTRVSCSATKSGVSVP